MQPNPQFPAHLVTFTEKIRKGKLYFLSKGISLMRVKNQEKVKTLLNAADMGNAE